MHLMKLNNLEHCVVLPVNICITHDQLELCQNDVCWIWSKLHPYMAHNFAIIPALIPHAFALSGSGGWGGATWIDKSSRRQYIVRANWLECENSSHLASDDRNYGLVIQWPELPCGNASNPASVGLDPPLIAVVLWFLSHLFILLLLSHLCLN